MFLGFFLLSFSSICLFCPIPDWFVFYLIFYYYPLEACLFSKDRQMGVDPVGRGGEERGGSTGKTPGMGNLNLNMMCEKSLFLIKVKTIS